MTRDNRQRRSLSAPARSEPPVAPNRAPDALPHKLSVEIAAGEQFIGAAGGDKLRVDAVLPD